jgi:hypothetical protein
VMLRLCEPFLDQMESKKDKIDVKYLFCNDRINFKLVSSLRFIVANFSRTHIFLDFSS